MPKANQEPNPYRRQTRAANANAHPGKVVMEVLGGRRNQEEIEKDKEAKKERREAREKKKIQERAAIEGIADFEDKMALIDKNQESMFPRHQTEVNAPSKPQGSLDKKRKGKAKHLPVELDDGNDDTASNSERGQPVKKRKTNYVAVPFRRTETYLRPGDLEIPPVDILMEDTDIDIEGDTVTPKPRKPKLNIKHTTETKSEDENSHSESEIGDDDYATPRAFQKTASNFLPDSNFDLTSTDSSVHQESESESKDETDQSDDGSDIYVPMNKSVGEKNNTNKQQRGGNVQEFQSIDLSKVQIKAKGTKKKRAFRMEVEGQRAVIGKMERKQHNPSRTSEHPARNTTSSGNHIYHSAQSKVTSAAFKSNNSSHSAQSKVTTRSAAFKSNNSSHSAQSKVTNAAFKSNNGHKEIVSKLKSRTSSGRHAPSPPAVSQPEVNFRNSATAGNGVGIIQSTHTNRRESGGKSKPTATAETSGLSDEDDSVEREAILQSPPKGTKRLSSKVIVKIETGSNENKPRSRSKKHIINPEVLSGWTRFIEPNFVYFYFFELAPWPTSGSIAACAQNLWDWRFGDLHPIELAKSSSYLQLLNQKLCDIRSQTALSAFTNLDIEFQYQLANYTGDTPQDLDGVKEFRQRHAKYLSKDKRFLFGKYSVSEGGKVRKSRPYQSSLILRTFASSFKHLKDVKLKSESDENDSRPLPASRYPQTLLAITTAAVERAVELTHSGDYDFVTNKLIPKPDPNHPMRKLTTSMFAFSETTWEPRAAFYLQKSILNLKDKEWEDIMDAAAEYSNVLKPSKGKEKARSQVQRTEEEQELEYDTDSESDEA